MVKKACGKVKIYANKAIVSLAIPTKIRLKIEAKRLLYQITKVAKNRYTLICCFSPLSGTHTPRQLNEVLSQDETLIPMSFLEWKGSKLTLTKAVQLTNNYTTIAAAQKAGRAKKIGSINKDELEQAELLDQFLDGQAEGQPQ
jgi:hypothetical protein